MPPGPHQSLVHGAALHAVAAGGVGYGLVDGYVSDGVGAADVDASMRFSSGVFMIVSYLAARYPRPMAMSPPAKLRRV